MAAAEAPRMNYRTMMSCCDSRRVSRRMRRALREFHNAGGVKLENGDGDDARTDSQVGALGKRAAELEEENRELSELVEAQSIQLEGLERQAAALETGQQPDGDAERVDAGEDQERRRVSERGPRHFGAGVVTLEELPSEGDALGPAAPLVAAWRGLRNPAARLSSRVERARATVRRWELEIAGLGDLGLTLPPETEPLDDSRREDHLRWRKAALTVALAKARRLCWLRRVLTLELRWS